MYKLNKIYIFKLLPGNIFAVCIGGFALGWVRQAGPCIENLFLAGYGGIPMPLEIDSYLRIVLIILVPQVFLIFILADYMLKDFTICSVYIFTRANQRRGWFARKCLDLLLFTALYYLIQFVALFFFGQIGGLVIYNQSALIYILVNEFTLLVLLGFIYVLTVNILSLKVGINHAFLTIILFLTVSSAFTIIFGAGEMLKFIPVSHAMLIWHDSERLLLYRDFIGGYLSNYTLAFSMVYLLLVLLLLVIIGIRLVDRLEIIGFEEEG